MDIPLIDIVHFLLAVSIGFAVGFERQVHSERGQQTVITGTRTFIFTGVLGFALTYFFNDNISLLTFVLAALMIIVLSVPILKEKVSEPGLTSAVAMILVLLTGMLSGMYFTLEALFIGIFTLGMLTAKRETHRFVHILSDEDIKSALRFITVGAILIPLAYTIGDVNPLIGPGRVFDPVKALLMIVFVSSMSFTSYLVIKMLGAGKGIKISAFLGGFVSSAASTASLSQKVKEEDSLRPVSASGIVLTNLSMILKSVVLLIVLTSLFLTPLLIVPIVILLIVSVVPILLVERSEIKEDIDLKLGTPFAVIPAAKFGLLFLVISAVSYLGKIYVGEVGVYAVALGGLVSTTSVAASLGTLYNAGELSLSTTLSTLLLSLGLGSVSKMIIAFSYDKLLGKRAVLYLGAVTLAAFLSAFIIM